MTSQPGHGDDLRRLRVSGRGYRMPELNWRTSSYSDKVECVEVAVMPEATALRDSKDRDGRRLVVSAARWRSFLAHVKNYG
jgi:hypothetical protein